MQISKLDDPRSNQPCGEKGQRPRRPLADCKLRKTYQGILQCYKIFINFENLLFEKKQIFRKEKWEKGPETANKLRHASGPTPSATLNMGDPNMGKTTSSSSSTGTKNRSTENQKLIANQGISKGGNKPAIGKNYNRKRVVRVHELDQWFKATFGYWPSNSKEPILVDMGKVGQVLHYIQEVSIFRGQPVCGFDVEKVHQDKVAAFFKMREVNNQMGNQFAQYVSFVLTNSQTYVIDTRALMAKGWMWVPTNMTSH
uniref:Uncharacterized protein n=1 Tax=Romanomermis culicivorax TaxID=13658 RepID=A0A915JV91_ROMCU